MTRVEVLERITEGKFLTYGEVLHGALDSHKKKWQPTVEDSIEVCGGIHRSSRCHREENGHPICKGCVRATIVVTKSLLLVPFESVISVMEEERVQS